MIIDFVNDLFAEAAERARAERIEQEYYDAMHELNSQNFALIQADYDAGYLG